MKDIEGGLSALKIKPEQLCALVNMIEDKTINGKIAKTVFAEMFETGDDPAKIVKDKGLVQVTDTAAIEAIVREVCARCERCIRQKAFLHERGRGRGL